MGETVLDKLLEKLDGIANGGVAYEDGKHSLIYVTQSEARELAEKIRHDADLAWQYSTLNK